MQPATSGRETRLRGPNVETAGRMPAVEANLMTRTDRNAFSPARAWAWVALASALSGCSAQVDSDYQGEPLATIRGTVALKSGALDGDRPVNAAILWVYQDSANQYQPKYVGDRISVRGSFPANFTLDVYTPPPAAAQLTTDETLEGFGISIPAATPLGVWTGFLVAIDSQASDADVTLSSIVGVDVDHAIVYVDGGVKPLLNGDPITTESALQGLRADAVRPFAIGTSPGVGFHLAKMNPQYQAAMRTSRDCLWADACVHVSTADPLEQAYLDWSFQRCKERFPQNPSCSMEQEPRVGEPASSIECRERYGQKDHSHCNIDLTQVYIENPSGLGDPITIQIGTSLFDIGG